MNIFFRQELAPKMPLHDKAVFTDLTSVKCKDSIALLVDTAFALIRGMASLITELIQVKLEATGRPVNCGPALSTIYFRHGVNSNPVDGVLRA
jgi:hypothetical protein